VTHRLTLACRRTLDSWCPPGPEQSALRDDYLAHLARHREDGWSRACAGSHLTASTLICQADRPRVLLTLHAKLGRWLQTGGHLEPTDSDLEAAALREAGEESGLGGLRLDPRPLVLSRHQVPCGPTRPTYHLDVQFLALAGAATAPVVSAESTAVAWFEADRLPTTDHSVRQLVAAAAQRLAW
jgi:8-oxo-dGTP pyrophosphatase MutT (NUDIX family)